MASTLCNSGTCIFFSVSNMIILVLGVAGNGLVIWIAGFKVKKSVIGTWYLSLAVSDFLFCCLLPFGITYSIKGDWIFGLFMCKFRYFIMFLNMYSSIFLLTIISVDRCVVVMFPVWAQNKRTIKKASVMIVLAWIMSAGLSMPMAIFRSTFTYNNTKTNNTRTSCFNEYVNDRDYIALVASRFVFGFLIPFLIIIACCGVIIRKLKSNQMARAKKPFKIMTALVTTLSYMHLLAAHFTFSLFWK
ncbi:hypothetical protein NFI96_006880 [Prochilodus magdalenae]|nr:hypothetical protein NFI96_006880 [Prochilodus magdalenae]